jgi:hypothetical protein
VKRYKVVSQHEVLKQPCDDKNTLERQLEDFLNRQAAEGWHYKAVITSLTADHKLGIDFVVLETERDSY